MRKSLVFPAVLVLSASAAEAGPLKFTLDNKSSFPVTGFYASLAGTQDWGGNMVGEEFAPGANATVTLDAPDDVCEFDIKTEFDGADDLVEDSITLCGEDVVYTITDAQ